MNLLHEVWNVRSFSKDTYHIPGTLDPTPQQFCSKYQHGVNTLAYVSANISSVFLHSRIPGNIATRFRISTGNMRGQFYRPKTPKFSLNELAKILRSTSPVAVKFARIFVA